jgi:hypothetical protein
MERKIPDKLQKELLRIAISTDIVSEFDIDSWRVSAVTAARWLLRVAAVSEQMPESLQREVRQIKEIAKKMNALD